MRRKKILILLVGLAIILAVSVLFINTQSFENSSHSNIIDNLRKIKQYDAMLDRSVLSSRYQLFHNYSIIDEYIIQLRESIDELERSVIAKYAKDSALISDNLGELASAYKEKNEIIEDFKTDNALLKNSLNIFSGGVNEFMSNQENKVEINKFDMQDLLHNIMVLNISRDKNEKIKLLEQVYAFKNYKHGFNVNDTVDFENLLKHAEIIIEKREVLNNSIDNILQSSIRKSSTDLQRYYLEYYKNQQVIGGYFNVTLFVFALILIGFIIRILFRNQKYADDLFREKESAIVTLHSIGDAVITTDSVGMVTYLNPVAEKLTGWSTRSAKGMLSTKIFNVVNEHSHLPIVDPVLQCIQDDSIVWISNESVLIKKDGNIFPIEDSTAPIKDRDNNTIGAIIVFHDVSKARSLKRELEWHASHDPLTGLSNRREFENRLNRLLNSSKQNDSRHALLYIDLDQFKIINDTCGHIAGDELLRHVTSLLALCLKSDDVLARLGGDEFGVLLENCSQEKAFKVASDILKNLQEFRFVWKGNIFLIGGSIGQTTISRLNSNSIEILRNADTACYVAKDKGRNRIHIYEESIDIAKHQGEMKWISRITQALEQDRFVLYRQKIKSFDDDRSDHYEILLRMIDEKGNLVLPGPFISAAERYDLMNTIDQWVIRKTFSNRSELLINDNTVYSINLSGQSLSIENFLHFVVKHLNESGIKPEKVCFEITETAAITNLRGAMRFINTLKKMGCKFSLDDFGMGLSSFSYLKQLPVNYLKIDGSFIKDILDDRMDYAIVEAINEIGHVLGLETIAEFVESEEIYYKLKLIGVDYGQGIFIEKPEPFESVIQNRLVH